MMYSKKPISNFIIGTFYLSGEPILPHLLRCSGFAVKYHSFIPCASYLRQPLLMNNSRTLELFIKREYPKFILIIYG